MEFTEYVPFWDMLTQEHRELIASTIEFRQVNTALTRMWPLPFFTQ